MLKTDWKIIKDALQEKLINGTNEGVDSQLAIVLGKVEVEIVKKETFIEPVKSLDPDLIKIMGTPNFSCGRIARRLREKGYEINTRAEDEQAMVIHVLLHFYNTYPGNWMNGVNNYLKED